MVDFQNDIIMVNVSSYKNPVQWHLTKIVWVYAYQIKPRLCGFLIAMTLTGLRLKKNVLTIFIVASDCQDKFTILIQGKLDGMTQKKT